MAGNYQVVVTPQAQEDLDGILAYLIETESYTRAINVQRSIMDTIYSLEEMPTRHARVLEILDDLPADVDCRRVVAKGHRIIFTIEEAENQVLVVRIIHVKRGPEFVKDALL